MKRPVVVIIGGGFGGLTTAKALKNANVDIVLIDKTNHHLFQPLLYQVATAALSPGDIAAPIRAILKDQKNVKVIMGEVISINRNKRTVCFEDREIHFDYLVIAPGSRHSYFGKNEWEKFAPGLKTIDDAIRIREKILLAFEEAERLTFEATETENQNINPEKYLTFVIVGGGPTGVEIAGAIAEIAKHTMLKDFRFIDPANAKIILVEAMDRILLMYSPELSEKAKQDLEKIGVKVMLNTMVEDVNESGVKLKDKEFIETPNVIWAAGNVTLPIMQTLNSELDRAGRAIVQKDLTIPGEQNIFVIGDAANAKDEEGNVLPGIAPVALQQGKYVAKIIRENTKSGDRKPFEYFDKGKMATIGRAKAIAEVWKLKLSGFTAWLAWSFIHVMYLIGYRNRYRVMAEWVWLYFTRKNGIRLITNKSNQKEYLQERS